MTPQAGPPESTRAPKPLSARRYAISIAWRLALFVALILGFPLVTYAVVRLSNCRSVGGACGAVALLSGIYLKPLIILLIASAIIRPSWRRARAIGRHPAWTLLLPLLVLASGPFLMLVGTHWSVGFVLGAANRVPPPYHFLLAVLLMAWLTTHPAAPATPAFAALRRLAWTFIALATATAVSGLALQVAWYASMQPPVQPAQVLQLSRAMALLAATNAYAGPLAILAALVLILLAWHARRQAARPA